LKHNVQYDIIPSKEGLNMAEDIIKRNKRQNAWIKNNADRINFMMPKGTKERLQTAAYKRKTSVSDYIRQAIAAALEQDNI